MLHLLIPAAIGTCLAASGQWTPLRQGMALLPALVLFPFWKTAVLRTAAGYSYALTNRRVLIIKLGGMRRSLEERDLRETQGMRLVREKKGIGTIVFEKQTRVAWHGQSGSVETYEFSFKHISGAEQVYGQITAARDSAR